MSRSKRSPRSAVGGSLLVVALVLVLLIYRAITGGGSLITLEPTSQPPAETPDAGSGAWYTVYFSDPTAPGANERRGGPDEALAAAIDRARLSVDIAAYELDLDSLRGALLAAHQRGVSVRLVTDSDYLDEAEVQDLIDADIPVLGDRREGLMHNKFVIIDRQEVWTGSMNLTENGAYRNNNNLIRIRSSNLAQDYLAEFEEMFVDDQFGPGSPADTPFPELVVQDTRLGVSFSPDDGTASRLVDLIEGAQESINFLAFSFTSDDLAAAMLGRARAGVLVSGVFENSQYRSNVGTEYDNLRAAGLDVHLDGNPANMHHKVIIIDGEIVVTGSYNFSASAETRNDENILILYSPEIAGLYMEEFDRVYAQAQP